MPLIYLISAWRPVDVSEKLIDFAFDLVFVPLSPARRRYWQYGNWLIDRFLNFSSQSTQISDVRRRQNNFSEIACIKSANTALLLTLPYYLYFYYEKNCFR